MADTVERGTALLIRRATRHNAACQESRSTATVFGEQGERYPDVVVASGRRRSDGAVIGMDSPRYVSTGAVIETDSSSRVAPEMEPRSRRHG